LPPSPPLLPPPHHYLFQLSYSIVLPPLGIKRVEVLRIFMSLLKPVNMGSLSLINIPLCFHFFQLVPQNVLSVDLVLTDRTPSTDFQLLLHLGYAFLRVSEGLLTTTFHLICHTTQRLSYRGISIEPGIMYNSITVLLFQPLSLETKQASVLVGWALIHLIIHIDNNRPMVRMPRVPIYHLVIWKMMALVMRRDRSI
jgi:hypothetical protein